MTLLSEPRPVAYVPSRPSFPVDHELFRRTMAQVCTPVSVVSVMDGARPHASTVSAFASQSMEPPMVLVSLATTSRLLPLMPRGGRFGLNVLGADQADVAMHFASKSDDKFAGSDWVLRDGAPALTGAAVWLACEVTDTFTSGDHIIVCGTVVAARETAAAPLTYHGRTFGTHAHF